MYRVTHYVQGYQLCTGLPTMYWVTRYVQGYTLCTGFPEAVNVACLIM